MKYFEVPFTPNVMINTVHEATWPSSVNQSAIIITVHDVEDGKAAFYNISGDKKLLAEAINQVMFNDEELAIELLQILGADADVINKVLTGNSNLN